ncbi:MAG: DNA topoisomerase 3 [Clostridiales bacterium]|nr:DNA topoisomerase 3 [Clostridiales bacterium]
MYQLVIAEKPSVAQSIAKLLGAYKRNDGYLEGGGYLVSWCVGHLVGLAQPDAYDERLKKWRREDLPLVPENWKWEVAPDKENQFEILKSLMSREDVSELVCATDAGREGELIFRLVYHQADCKKPFKRLWISSMEDTAIREGFENLKDSSEYDNLYAAALCRSKADWLVGINATRLFTTLYNERLTVGRVQTPTLAMLTERDGQIKNFVKEKYYNVHLTGGGLEAAKEKIFDEKEADAVLEACNSSEAKVISVTSGEKTVSPPKLYDLTTLQRESNRYYGYTAQKTLDYTQSLYEKKLVTYPRTDSQFLTEDMEETAAKMAASVCEVFGYTMKSAPDVKRVINNAKVSDHHAIIPTVEITKQDLSSLTSGERDILQLVAQRLLCATAGKQRFLETEIIVECGGYEFTAKGKVVLEQGFKEYEDSFRSRLKSADKKKPEDTVLPDVKEGQVLSPVTARKSEHFTSPPKSYTEDTLLSAMETAGNESFDEDTEKKGLGTPATRASMIEKLVRSGYAERKGKQLIPTEAGKNLAAVLPEDIKSPKLTAEWENTLMRMERGEVSPEAFLSDITEMVDKLVDKYDTLPDSERQRFSKAKAQKEQVGVCPRCGSPVYEGQKNFYCSNRECKFCIWKESKWLTGMKKKINKKAAESLLKSGKVRMSGLYSAKTGKNFDATLVMEDTGQYVNYHLEFDRSGKGKRQKKS